jgi:hypothetical protein
MLVDGAHHVQQPRERLPLALHATRARLDVRQRALHLRAARGFPGQGENTDPRQGLGVGVSESVATAQAARGWSHATYRHLTIQSSWSPTSAFAEAAQTPLGFGFPVERGGGRGYGE